MKSSWSSVAFPVLLFVAMQSTAADLRLLEAVKKGDKAAVASLIGKKLDVNEGIAVAQNVGIAVAKSLGASHVLFLDQDSVPEDGMVSCLYAALQKLENGGCRVACVGPRVRFPGSREALATRRTNAAFRGLLAFETARTRALFERGLPLTDMVGRRLRHEVRIFARGGLAILARIEAVDYDVFRRRPTLGRAELLRLVVRGLWR